MTVKFVSDSACDIYEREGIDNYASVPLTISVENQHFLDVKGLDKSALLDALDNAHEASKSACPSLQAWLDAFGDADTIYIVTVTSGLSGTYNSARVAADMYLETHPNAKIHIFDSLSTGPEEAMIMDKIIELDAQGLSFEEVVEQVKAYQKTTHLYFSLGSLHTMAMNGRVPKVVAGAFGVLNIRVAAIASEKGEVEVVGKTRGQKKRVKFAEEYMESMGYKGGKMQLSYVDDDSLVQEIAGYFKNKYPNADIVIRETTALCTYYVERNGFVIGFETE